MTKIHRQRVVPYTPIQMYELVNDIEAYQHFVPYCIDSVIVEKEVDQVVASLTFGFGMIKQSFTTKNQLKPPESIKLELVSGPFQTLSGVWAFLPEKDHTKIILDIEFALATNVMNWMIEPMLHQTIEKLVDVFSKRAKDVYG